MIVRYSIVNNVAEINTTGDETMFVVSCETDSSESMLIFSVDKCIIDGEWIYKFLCLLKDRLQPDVTPRLRTSALGLIILWSSKTRGSMSA